MDSPLRCSVTVWVGPGIVKRVDPRARVRPAYYSRRRDGQTGLILPGAAHVNQPIALAGVETIERGIW